MIDLAALFGLDRLTKGPPAQHPVIPIAGMIALWDSESDHTVTKLRVMNIGDQTDSTYREYPWSAGACNAAWLTDPLNTPLGVFAMLLADGFPSREDTRAALYQFRNVEGQREWASDLLQRLDDPDIDRILDEEELWEEARNDSFSEE